MVMHFQLIITYATYERMINMLFVEMIIDIMEVYVFKMMLKFKVGIDYQRYLE